jgi:DNA polymerase III delta prime subunit
MPLIILEGPDGSGKTTLAQELRKELGVYTWLTSSNSKPTESSQIEEVTRWINNTPASIINVVDRHPLISEFVYGSVIRNHVRHSLSFREMALEIGYIQPTLLIHCQVNWRQQNINIDEGDHMEGVDTNIRQLRRTYHQVMQALADNGLEHLDYDYTNPGNIMDHIFRFVRESLV